MEAELEVELGGLGAGEPDLGAEPASGNVGVLRRRAERAGVVPACRSAGCSVGRHGGAAVGAAALACVVRRGGAVAVLVALIVRVG